MSQLKLKQINPYGAADGSLILFDGTKPVWSNQQTRGFVIPSGNTSQRSNPVNGLIRYNNEVGKLEVYQNNNWSSVLNSESSFLDFADTPNSYSGKSGYVPRVNASETGMDFVQFPTAIKKYRFRVNYTGTNPTTIDKSIDPSVNDWTISIINTDDLVITHNLGREPAFCIAYGRDSSITTKYISKTAGSGGTGAFIISYDITNTNQCKIENIITTNVNAASGTHAYFDIYFLANGF